MECEKCPLNNLKIQRMPYDKVDIVVVFDYPVEQDRRPEKIKEFLNTDKKIYVTYGVKCTVPQEIRDKNKDILQITRYCNVLHREIEIANPDYILLLGKIAYTAFKGTSSGSHKTRGKIVDINGRKVMYTYSLEDVLRNGGFNDSNTVLRFFLNDLNAFRSYINGTLPEIEGELKPWDGKVSDFNGKVVALDAEWDNQENLLVFSISDGTLTKYITKHMHNGDSKLLYNLFAVYSRFFIVVANRPADERILKKNRFYLWDKYNFIDIFNIARLLDDNMDISLENIVDRWCGTLKIKETMKKGKKFEEMTLEELIRYNAVDSKYTIKAFSVMYRELMQDKKLFNYWKYFVRPVEDMLARVSMQGFEIDMNELERSMADVEKEISKVELELLGMVREDIIQEHQSKGLSLTRNDFIRDILVKQFQIKPQKLTDKGQISVSEDALKEYSNIEFVQKLLYWKKLQKLHGTFLKGLVKNIKDDGKIYPNIVLWATKTGRTACFNPNLQQVPRDMPMIEKLKDLYKAPDGWLMGARDLSTSEIRIMGWLAKEPNILEALYKGIDIHKQTASMILGKKPEEVSKEERQMAKAVNFGFLYGASAKTFQEYAKNNYGVDISYKDAERFRIKFFSFYDRIPAFHEYVKKKVIENGYIRSPLGRMRRLPHINSDDESIRGQALRQAINFPIQSFSSDLALIGMYLFWKEIKDKDDARLLWFIHDSIFFMCKEEKMPEYMALLKYCMEEASVKYIKEYFNVRVGYPVISEGKVGKTWHRMEDWKDEV